MRRTIKSNVGRWAGRFNYMKKTTYSSDFFSTKSKLFLWKTSLASWRERSRGPQGPPSEQQALQGAERGMCLLLLSRGEEIRQNEGQEGGREAVGWGRLAGRAHKPRHGHSQHLHQM